MTEIYKIVSGQTIQELEQEVNDLIQIGWKPLGGVICGNDGLLLQTLLASSTDKNGNRNRTQKNLLFETSSSNDKIDSM